MMLIASKESLRIKVEVNMFLHSYSKCWLHIVWATHDRKKSLNTVIVRKQLSNYLSEYSKSKQIFMKKNFVNSDHIHVLIDLPTSYSIENVLHILKGSSSHWINQSSLISEKFSWGRGYGVFSVSESNLEKVCKYIADQEEHHKNKSFLDEYRAFINAYGMKYITE